MKLLVLVAVLILPGDLLAQVVICDTIVQVHNILKEHRNNVKEVSNAYTQYSKQISPIGLRTCGQYPQSLAIYEFLIERDLILFPDGFYPIHVIKGKYFVRGVFLPGFFIVRGKKLELY